MINQLTSFVVICYSSYFKVVIKSGRYPLLAKNNKELSTVGYVSVNLYILSLAFFRLKRTVNLSRVVTKNSRRWKGFYWIYNMFLLLCIMTVDTIALIGIIWLHSIPIFCWSRKLLERVLIFSHAYINVQ